MSVALTVILLGLVLLLGLVVHLAVVSARSDVCRHSIGEKIPERVCGDPELSRRANEEVGRHATWSAVLLLTPIGYLGWMALREGVHEVPTHVLAVLAVYVIGVSALFQRPFEMFKNW